jgi:hypothetical protein
VGRLAALTVSLLLLGAAPAAAAPGFLGTGHDPGVAVDGKGAAHVAWFGSGTPTVEYCLVPRGKRKCTRRQTLPLPEEGTAKVQVLTPRPGVVAILAPIVSKPGVLFTSADNGATFLPHATGAFQTIEDAVYGPGDVISLISNTGPAKFGRYALDGSGPPELPVQFGDALESLDTSLASYGAGYAAFFSGGAMRSTLFKGIGDPNLQQSWVEGPRLGEDRTTPAAVGGRSGTFIAYVNRRGGASDIRVRRLRDDKLRRAKRVSRDDPADLEAVQGPRGDIAVLWTDFDGARYVRSRTGTRWTRARYLFHGNDAGDLRPALGRRGGWVVWDGSPGNLGSHPIRIAAIPRSPRR